MFIANQSLTYSSLRQERNVFPTSEQAPDVAHLRSASLIAWPSGHKHLARWGEQGFKIKPWAGILANAFSLSLARFSPTLWEKGTGL